ncbi:MAG: divalent metal cation transporter [Pseudomonadota bacterium]
MPALDRLIQILGPGVLFAASAVGLSHLVQATRAGATHGLSLALFIAIACIMKYPSLRFGGEYAAATGETLIQSYRRIGWWALGLYAAVEIFGAAFIVAAIAIFLYGLLDAIFAASLSNGTGTALLLTIVAFMLLSGQYRRFEALTKALVVFFSVLILAATALTAPSLELSLDALSPPPIDGGLIIYLIPLIGFMPTAPTASVMQSLWTQAKQRNSAISISARDNVLDFNIGYVLTCALALCFLVLGAALINGPGLAIEASNSGFARQALSILTESFGPWSYWVVATTMVLVIASTLIAVVDGLSRAIVAIAREAKAPLLREQEDVALYRITLPVLCAAAALIAATLTTSFTRFLDLTAIATFTIGPIIAWLNHRSVTSDRMPAPLRPGPLLRAWSLGAILCLIALALVYYAVRLSG